MILRSLRLTNYRRFRSLDLEFPENVIGVIGRNGMGKTTIVEAVGWALYGTRTAKRTDKHEMRSQSASQSDACEAELVFACGGHEYRAVRRLKGKNAVVEAAIYRAGQDEPEAIQERGVNEFVEQLTGLDLDSFLVSVFARQKELDKLSGLQPEERRKAINRLINIERIDRARQRAREDRNDKRSYKTGLEAGLKDREELQKELEKFANQAAECEHSAAEAQEELVRQEEGVAETKDKLDRISRTRDRFKSLESERDRLIERRGRLQDTEARHRKNIAEIEAAGKALESLRPDLEAYERVKADKQKLDRAQVAHTAVQEKRKALEATRMRIRQNSERVTSLEAKLADLKPEVAQIQDVEDRIAALEQERDRTQTLIQEREGEVTSLRDQLRRQKARREQIVQLGPQAPCPTCNRPLHDHYDRVLREIDEEVAEITSRGTEAQINRKQSEEKLAGLKKFLSELRSRHHSLIGSRQQHASIEEQLAQAGKDGKALTADLQGIEEDITKVGKVDYEPEVHEELRQRFEHLSAVREQALKHEENVRRLPGERESLTTTLESIADTNARIEALVAESGGLGYNEKEWQKAQSAVEQAMSARDAAKDRLHELRQRLVATMKDVERLRGDIAEQERLGGEVRALEEELHYYDLLDEHLGRFRLELAGRIRPLIAHRASELLRLTTNSRYPLLELDEDYNIHLYDGPERFALARYSGGEQDLANLCLRIAISQVVAERSGANPINFIVLDEIFGSQDEERKGLILQALHQLSSQFRQIFVITHVEGVRDTLPSLITVEATNGRESQARLL